MSESRREYQPHIHTDGGPQSLVPSYEQGTTEHNIIPAEVWTSDPPPASGNVVPTRPVTLSEAEVAEVDRETRSMTVRRALEELFNERQN